MNESQSAAALPVALRAMNLLARRNPGQGTAPAPRLRSSDLPKATLVVGPKDLATDTMAEAFVAHGHTVIRCKTLDVIRSGHWFSQTWILHRISHVAVNVAHFGGLEACTSALDTIRKAVPDVSFVLLVDRAHLPAAIEEGQPTLLVVEDGPQGQPFASLHSSEGVQPLDRRWSSSAASTFTIC